MYYVLSQYLASVSLFFPHERVVWVGGSVWETKAAVIEEAYDLPIPNASDREIWH